MSDSESEVSEEVESIGHFEAVDEYGSGFADAAGRSSEGGVFFVDGETSVRPLKRFVLMHSAR